MQVGMIHQPHFLPWPGYFARCLAVDVYVVLDNVKFNRNHYQQRTRYVDSWGVERWLSLPIAGFTRSSLFSEVQIAETFKLAKWSQSFVGAYRKSEDFLALWGAISGIIERANPSLLDVNRGTLLHLLRELSTRPSGSIPAIAIASELEVSAERTQRLIDLCSALGITHLVVGRYTLASHDLGLLEECGIKLLRQEYDGRPEDRPVPGRSVLHYIATEGREQVAEKLRSDWKLYEL